MNYYFDALRSEDEAKLLMQEMSHTLKKSLGRHLPSSVQNERKHKCNANCETCEFSDNEPFPVHESKYFRFALKAGRKNGVLYGNFPYPYRLIIALKRHDSFPNEEEWKELRVILKELQSSVCDDLGGDYSSFASLQDIYYRKKANNEQISESTHFFLHFIFRFPKGMKTGGATFRDPNPYDQFTLSNMNLVKELETKQESNFIYKKQPDIINIQELTYEQAEDMKREFSNHRFIGYKALDGKPLEKIDPNDWVDEIVCIGYRADRFDCVDNGLKWLSPTPETPSICPGASRNRIVVWVKLRDRLTNKVFCMFNSHYDHLGTTKKMVDAEINTINLIAKDDLWFSTGERFYGKHLGEELYNYFMSTITCKDIRDASLMGHFGESGTWGGFENDPYASQVIDGSFECDTLDVTFTNTKQSLVLLSYHLNGAYDPETETNYRIQDTVKKGYRLASDHFMSGFYMILDK
ncbi:MAG: hypothetical protein AAGG81_01335 [Chlamydiota bacterium]